MRELAAFVGLATVLAFGPCKRSSDATVPPAPTTSMTPIVASCACTARQVCATGRCVYDSVDYAIEGIALGAPTFACALYANGEVWCAGKNTVGQLGNGKAPSGPRAADEPPARVSGLGSAAKVVAGTQHACALVAKTVWCWGNGSSTPSRVAGLGEADAIYAAATRTCAVVGSERTVACWGAEGVVKAVKGVANVASVGIGDERSCALLGSTRTVACWGKDGAASKVPELNGIDEVVASDKFACARDLLGVVTCWGGRFGAKPSTLKFLESTGRLGGGADLVCGIDYGGVVRCSDTKTDYRVTLGDSGTRAATRLLAVGGKFTMNVHWGDDVVDADDELSTKRVIDMLGQNAPRAELATVREAKGLRPPPPARSSSPSVLSCDNRGFGGTCTEYPEGRAGAEEETRCRNAKGTWSSSPCLREKLLGSCKIGTNLDRGATLVIYDSQWTKGPSDARAMCIGGYAGTFLPP